MSSSVLPPFLIDPRQFSVPPPVIDPNAQGFGFINIAGGIPQGQANNPLDRYGTGAIFMADLARRQLAATGGTSLAGYDEFIQPLQGMMGRLNSLPQELSRSALASTAGASVAAANAARMAGSGGQARSFAARGAADAAVGQSAALANALVQGRTAAAQFDFGVAGSLSSAMLQRAQARERIYGRDAELSFQIAQLLGGIAAPGSQVTAASINKQSARETAWIPQTNISFGGSGGGPF